MNLHEDQKLFEQAIRATAEYKGLREIYIEKDYWVTFALYIIFNDAIGKQTVFKGGTALSKCYKLIDRFSEDIDLVVLRTKEESANQLNKKIKAISKVVDGVMPEVPIENVTQKTGMNRKTAHEYKKTFRGDYGQIRDVIIIEATWLGYFEPYTTEYVQSYIYEMMLNKHQGDLIEKHGLQSFEVQVLDVKRTLCEKIMSLVRFSHTQEPIESLKKKVRHTYDLHQLLSNQQINDFFHSKEFAIMLLKVGRDDVESYRNNNEWLVIHPKEALIFAEPDSTWETMSSTYNGVFKDLVFGEFPTQEQILKTIKEIAQRLDSVDWDVSL